MQKNILQRIFGSVKKGITNMPFTSTIIQRFSGINYNNGALTSKNYLAEYRNWVYPCVSARSEEVGNIKLKLFKDGVETHDHPVLDLLNRVNPYMTKHQLFEYTQAFKDLQGNAYWYLARDGKEGKGTIKEIYILKPDRVRIITNKTNPLQVEGYLFTQPDGQSIKFLPSEILHHKNFDPKAFHPFPHQGMGVIEAAAFAIDTDNEARTWNLNFFRNGARPDGILIASDEGANDPEQQDRLRSEWAEEHQGSENAHKISVLTGGVKYQELTRSQKDMDFLNQRTFSRDEILALFKTPKSIIGITDDVNRANAEASVYVFALRTVKPLMQKLVDTLNEFLLPEFGEGLHLDFESPVPEDRTAKTAEYTAGYNIWLSRNDIRRMEGLPETDNGEKMYGQFGEEVNDETPKPETVKATTKPETKAAEKEEPKTPGGEAVKAFLSTLPMTAYKKNVAKKGIDDATKKEHIDAWIKRGDKNTDILKKKIRNFFALQEKEVQANLKDELKGLEGKEFKYKAISDMLFDYDKSVASSISLITPFIQQYINESGKIANTLAGGEGFDDETESINKFKEDRAKYFATSINDTTQTDLLDSIQDGIDAQESLEDISKRVASIYEQAMDFRTDRIARTEVAASANFGTVEAYEQAGVSQHQWITVSPDDEDCLENDGEVADIGDAFPSGDTMAPVHPNCMCTTIPIFKD